MTVVSYKVRKNGDLHREGTYDTETGILDVTTLPPVIIASETERFLGQLHEITTYLENYGLTSIEIEKEE